MTACARAYVRLVGRVVLLVMMICAAGTMAAQSSDEGGPLQRSPDTPVKKALTNDSVIRMAKAGLDDSIVLQTIQSQPGRFELGADELIALKEAGVSPTVIAAMQAKAAGLAVRPMEVKRTLGGPLTPLPDEIGVYYKDKQGDWVPLKTERVVFKSGGWVKSTLTYNIIKQDMNGHLDGPKSPLVLNTGIQILIYTTAGTSAEEYAFLRFRQHKDGREFRTKTGGVLHSESGTQRDEVDFNPKRVAPQMYTFTVPTDIIKGEYGVLPPGAANQRGFADTGKIFTFSIPE